MSEVKAYTSEGITVSFDASRCIHAGECVRGLPQVFNSQAKPWIQPDKASAEAVAEVVSRCPTGALRVRWADRREEDVASIPEARLGVDGPVMLRGRIQVCAGEGKARASETRMALCRCGTSKHMPYCDRSHAGAGFKHDGGCSEAERKAVAAGELKITVYPGGPAQCDGPLTLYDAFGEVAFSGEQCWLCRCGASENKPFCDGSHKKIGFKG